MPKQENDKAICPTSVDALPPVHGYCYHRAIANAMDNVVPPRKRTERACDQCKRRKTKCSGEQNCYSCAAYGFECIYGRELKKIRGPAYVAYLEQTVKELETQIETSSSRSPDSTRSSSTSFSNAESSAIAAQSEADVDSLNTLGYPAGYGAPSKPTTSYLYGSCSGIEILRRMRIGLDAVVGFSTSTPAVTALTDALDRPVPELFNSPTTAFHVFSPVRDDLMHLIDVAFRESFWFRPFVDRQFIQDAVDRAYNTNPVSASSYSDKDEIALVYAIAAIGECLDKNTVAHANNEMDALGWKGVTYFRTVQGLIDPSNCERSMLALQTVICMAIYLISTSAVSRAHMFIGMAASASVRMGLHLPSTGADVPHHEQIMRKRTYRSIMAIDIYMATFLGLPCCLQGVDAYHDYVPQSDLEELARLRPMDDMEVTAQANMEVLIILRSAMADFYFSGSKPGEGQIYSVPCSVVRNHNRKLETWFASAASLNISQEFRVFVHQIGSYAQMIINSPFLHYLAIPSSVRPLDGNVAGAKCVMGAIRTIELLQKLKDGDSLNEANSFNLRSLAFAAVALLFVEFSGLDVPGVEAVKIASSLAEQLLEGMAVRHAAALGCYHSLQSLFQMKRELAYPLPDLSSSGTTSSWTSPSVNGVDGFDASGDSTSNVNFPSNTLHFQQMFD